jgi:hypothetical protein
VIIPLQVELFFCFTLYNAGFTNFKVFLTLLDVYIVVIMSKYLAMRMVLL